MFRYHIVPHPPAAPLEHEEIPTLEAEDKLLKSPFQTQFYDQSFL